MSRIDRLTAEERAEIKATVAKWPKLTEAKRESIRALFEPYIDRFAGPVPPLSQTG
jgi:hypothetical protein